MADGGESEGKIFHFNRMNKMFFLPNISKPSNSIKSIPTLYTVGDLT
jgi:hypothetical protein